MTQKKIQSTSIFTPALLATAKHWGSPSNGEIANRGPHRGNTLEPRASGPGEWGHAVGAAALGPQDLNIEQQDSRTHSSEHGACAEGNLKTCQLSFSH